MITITEGMTPEQFTIAMNSNFDSIKYSTTGTSVIGTNATPTNINDIFVDILSDTISPISNTAISGGLRGSSFASRLNANFNSYLSPNMVFTVGADKNYTTITGAVTRAVSGNTILIDEGTYNETLDLTSKALNLTGSGTLGTIIKYSVPGSAITTPTVNIAQDCVFSNIVFSRRYIVDQPNYGYIVNINNCNVQFNDCKITCALTDFRQYIMNITNSTVNFYGDIDCNSTYFGVVDLNKVDVNGNSIFNFNGNVLRAVLLTHDNSVSTVITNEFWTLSESSEYAIKQFDSSILNLTIGSHKFYSQTSGIEQDPGLIISTLNLLGDNSYFKLTGELKGMVLMGGLGAKALFKDVTAPIGRVEVMPYPTDSVANTNEVTFDNCNIYFDFDDQVSGVHLLEDYRGITWNIINGSVFEYSGYSGVHDTYGQPISLHENAKLTILNSEIIDNCNDPNGYNYLIAILSGELDIEDSILTNQNWDGLDTHPCIRYAKTIDSPVKIKLKNVVFNSNANTNPIHLVDIVPFNENDYVDAVNLTNNTGFDICDSMADWNYLIGNVPI